MAYKMQIMILNQANKMIQLIFTKNRSNKGNDAFENLKFLKVYLSSTDRRYPETHYLFYRYELKLTENISE